MPRFDRSSRTAMAGYRPGGDTACPECGRSHWLIGRQTAECAGCATALPIVAPYWNTIRLRAA